MKMIVVKKSKKGSYCIRCGQDRSFIKKEKVGCSVYGTIYKKHLYK